MNRQSHAATVLFEVLEARLSAQGYGPAPVRGDAQLDASTAADLRCQRCGRHGLAFRAFAHRSRAASRGGYVAVAHCGDCGAAIEF
jgi:hypothetical protein